MLSAFRRPHPHGRSMYIQQFALVLTAHIGLGLPVCQYGLPSAPPPPVPPLRVYAALREGLTPIHGRAGSDKRQTFHIAMGTSPSCTSALEGRSVPKQTIIVIAPGVAPTSGTTRATASAIPFGDPC